MKIQTNKELEEWLSDNNFFEDGHVLKIETSPLRIEIGFNIKGNYEANSERVIQTFTLQPDKIIEWTFPDNGDFIPSDDIYIEGIDAIDVSPNIGLEFSTPLTFKLIANSIYITKNEAIRTIFKPWTSNTEIFVTSSLSDIPKPDFWKTKLKELGHDITFRYYGSEEKTSDKLPYPDYSGYYIQTLNQIEKSNEGIFIKHLTKDNESISIHFENKDKELNSIWTDLTIVLSEMPDAKINSGNCKFTGQEWRRHLNKSEQ